MVAFFFCISSAVHTSLSLSVCVCLALCIFFSVCLLFIQALPYLAAYSLSLALFRSVLLHFPSAWFTHRHV